MELPTARVMKENSYRIGSSRVFPYWYFYAAISPFARLEVNGTITEVMGVPAFPGTTGPTQGNFKDKAIDLKYQFIPEGKYMPAVALGVNDPSGTRIYPAQYLVASKQIYPFDFTIGFGNGRYGKVPLPSSGQGLRDEMLTDPVQWLKDSQFFYGVQFAPSEKYVLMVEYSPILYNKQTSDPAQPKYFQQPVPSHLNFGLRWRPLKWAELGLSYQRGNQVGVSLSLAFDVGKPLLPIYNAPYKEKPDERLNPITERMTAALAGSGFSDIVVVLDGDDLWIEVQNDRYYYAPKAVGVITGIVINNAPMTATNVNIVLKENGIPMVRVTTKMSDIAELYAGRLTVREFLYLSTISTDIDSLTDAPSKDKKYFKYGIKPSLQTFLNDPSGFFKYRAGVAAWVSYHPWAGLSFITGVEGYPLNTVTTTNQPLSIPVRSDISLYETQKVSLSRLMIDQIYKMPREVYGRLAAGLLEIEYAGLDGEVAMPLYDGRLMVGISGSAVKKRDSSNPFKMAVLGPDNVKNVYTTAFLNTRLNVPEKGSWIEVKAGRFLAGDWGARFTLSRFINGVVISVWYGVTNTSIFTDPYNRGYHDVGLSVTVPLRLFKGSDSRSTLSYLLSPWTRDVAQDIYHYNNLFDFIGRKSKIYLNKDADEMLK